MLLFYPPGLFEQSHMQYDIDRAADEAGEPSFEEMVEKAILTMEDNENGFFLMAEGKKPEGI